MRYCRDEDEDDDEDDEEEGRAERGSSGMWVKCGVQGLSPCAPDGMVGGREGERWRSPRAGLVLRARPNEVLNIRRVSKYINRVIAAAETKAATHSNLTRSTVVCTERGKIKERRQFIKKRRKKPLDAADEKAVE